MTKELIWQSLASPGWEHVRIEESHPGWTVFDSILVREHNGMVKRGGYTLVIDKQWRTLELRLMVETEPGVMDGIHLLTEGDGYWTDANENPMPELDGCLDVDIQWSPLTNTLPIRRIPLEVGQQEDIRVVYVALPELIVKPVTQRYERPSLDTVRYARPDGQFTLDLSMDRDGFVRDYPDLFHRTWPNEQEF